MQHYNHFLAGQCEQCGVGMTTALVDSDDRLLRTQPDDQPVSLGQWVGNEGCPICDDHPRVSMYYVGVTLSGFEVTPDKEAKVVVSADKVAELIANGWQELLDTDPD